MPFMQPNLATQRAKNACTVQVMLWPPSGCWRVVASKWFGTSLPLLGSLFEGEQMDTPSVLPTLVS